MLENKFDCLAVPLPESFRQDIEAGIDRLPTPTIVLQKDYTGFDFSQPEESWTPDSDSDSEDETQTGETSASYVPVDPCNRSLQQFEPRSANACPAYLWTWKLRHSNRTGK